MDDSAEPSAALPADQRPIDPTPVHTGDLPATPTRDRNIPATAWLEAPTEALHLGDDLVDDGADDGADGASPPVATYKRRIGRWLLWRAGPARGDHARYLAVDADDLARHHTFRLQPDGTGEGTGPDGQVHQRFRAWKEALRDS
jgi:hypothetical protein